MPITLTLTERAGLETESTIQIVGNVFFFDMIEAPLN